MIWEVGREGKSCGDGLGAASTWLRAAPSPPARNQGWEAAPAPGNQHGPDTAHQDISVGMTPCHVPALIFCESGVPR